MVDLDARDDAAPAAGGGTGAGTSGGGAGGGTSGDGKGGGGGGCCIIQPGSVPEAQKTWLPVPLMRWVRWATSSSLPSLRLDPDRGFVPLEDRAADFNVSPLTLDMRMEKTSLARFWRNRDCAIAMELQRALQGWTTPRPRQSTARMAMVMHSPHLPLVLLARKMARSALSPGCSGRHFGRAARVLAQDRLFALSMYYGLVMIDRAHVLPSPVRTFTPEGAGIPDAAEIAAFKASGASLSDAMMARARALWEESERSWPHLAIQVCWSGGIDSTALLCCLLAAANQAEDQKRKERVIVCLDDSSIREYPLFYEKHIVEAGIAQERIGGRDIAALAARPDRLTVTGELGDQLFGSDLMRAAFYGPNDENVQLSPDLRHFAKGLDAPWQDTLLPSLEDRGLLGGPMGAGRGEWAQWIAPQMARAPFPIVSTFDALWWLNFSLKWQNVVLRSIMLGSYNPTRTPHSSSPFAFALGNVRHFYEDRALQCWSCVKENHERKFADRTKWVTYKEPLKRVILDFTGDHVYYSAKLKIGSLCGVFDKAARTGAEESGFLAKIFGRFSRRQHKLQDSLHFERLVCDVSEGLWVDLDAGDAHASSSDSDSDTTDSSSSDGRLPKGPHARVLRWGAASISDAAADAEYGGALLDMLQVPAEVGAAVTCAPTLVAPPALPAPTSSFVHWSLASDSATAVSFPEMLHKNPSTPHAL